MFARFGRACSGKGLAAWDSQVQLALRCRLVLLRQDQVGPGLIASSLCTFGTLKGAAERRNFERTWHPVACCKRMWWERTKLHRARNCYDHGAWSNWMTFWFTSRWGPAGFPGVAVALQQVVGVRRTPCAGCRSSVIAGSCRLRP